jgi:hypothetical protein
MGLTGQVAGFPQSVGTPFCTQVPQCWAGVGGGGAEAAASAELTQQAVQCLHMRAWVLPPLLGQFV